MIRYAIKAGILLGYLLFMPLILGCGWMKLTKRKDWNIGDIYIYGYLLVFALFLVCAEPFIYGNYMFPQMAKAWNLFSVLVSAVVSAWAFRDVKSYVVEQKRSGKRRQNKRNHNMIAALCLAVCLLAISVLFVLPSWQDDTTETVMTTLATNTMYVRNPYTNEIMTHSERMQGMSSPLQMFFAVLCYDTGIRPAKVIHIVLPLFLLLLFYVVWFKVSHQLFGRDETKCGRFLIIVELIYMTSIYAKRGAEIGVFQNIWMPQTLLYNCLFPLGVLQCVNIMEKAKTQEMQRNERKICFFDFLLFVVAAQTVYYMGGVLAVLLGICTFAIILIGRIWNKCRN